MQTVLRSPSGKEVIIAPERLTVIIGERINPSGGGRKALTAALAAGNLDVVREEARRQVAAGAGVIDVNVQAADVFDEPATLAAAVRAVTEAVDAPISIDTNHPLALPAALQACAGRPLVNSVTGETESLERVLPLVAEHGACVIGLTADDDGIPTHDPERRLKIAERILEYAARRGILPEDVLIDCVTLPVGAENTAGAVTLHAVRLVREQLGVNLALGASNVSFGLPLRPSLNAAFLAMAIAAGVNAPIVDPLKMREVVAAADLLLGRDRFAARYLAYYRQSQAQPVPKG
jgi:5-methyltetrahydrofolate--homocysteine methyltransferase